MMRCRFPFTPPAGLGSRSGPDVLLAALSEAFRGDPRFAPMDAGPWEGEDVAWYPTFHYIGAVLSAVRAGRRIAIGPNVLWQLSTNPLIDATERTLAGYRNYAAVFTLSRWYSASVQTHFAQKTNHHLLDYPLPRAWLEEPWEAERRFDALVFVKGGAEEAHIAAAVARRFQAALFLKYGEYRREQLFRAARSARACFYVSREDHYPLAAVEIGLMGCPVISDERACPVVQHGITGILAPVRERGEFAPFAWSPDAAERMAVEWEAAAMMDNAAVRAATIRKHDPVLCRERVAAQLGLNAGCARQQGSFTSARASSEEGPS